MTRYTDCNNYTGWAAARGAGGCDANLCCSLVDVDFGLSTLHYALPEPFGLGSLVFGR